MTDRWVNARITVMFPMADVSPDSSTEEKMSALEDAYDAVLGHLGDGDFESIPGFVSLAAWEDSE